MEELLKKLNFKYDTSMLLLNAPEAINKQFLNPPVEFNCANNFNELEEVNFAIIFALNQKMVDDVLPLINEKLKGDAILWFVYPKKSSKKYKCDIDRDHGWSGLGNIGFEPVRQVAFDEDFSALRFRRVEYIKTITRSKEMALTKEAKERTTK